MKRPTIAQLRRELQHLADRARAVAANRRIAFPAAVLTGLLVVLTAIAVQQLTGSSDRDPAISAPAAPGTPTQTAPTQPPTPPPNPPAPPVAQPCQAVARVHQVRSGETLATIALRHGSAIEQIATDNGIAEPNRIRAGARLNVRPLCQGHAMIQPGDTLSSLASRYGTTVERLAASNPQLADVDRILAGGRLVFDPANAS